MVGRIRKDAGLAESEDTDLALRALLGVPDKGSEPVCLAEQTAALVDMLAGLARRRVR